MFHFWSNMMASTFSANKHPLGTHWAKEEYICYTQSKNVEYNLQFGKVTLLLMTQDRNMYNVHKCTEVNY